jgi:hypothetical protein
VSGEHIVAAVFGTLAAVKAALKRSRVSRAINTHGVHRALQRYGPQFQRPQGGQEDVLLL